MVSFSDAARRFAGLSGGIVFLAGVTVLLGWEIGAPFKNVLTGWPKMAPVTALAFVLAGLALCCAGMTSDWIGLKVRASVRSVCRWAGAACSAIVVLISLTKLAGFVTGRPLGIDLFFRELPGGPRPAEMAPATAGGFFLLGLALLLSRGTRVMPLYQSLTVMGGLIGWLGLNHSLFGGEPLPPDARMVLQTSLLLILLSAGILCVRTDGGLMALLTSDSLGGLIARRLMPAAFLLPIVLRWLRMEGQFAHWYGSQAGWSLFTLSFMLVFGALVWTAAVLLNRLESQRRTAESSVRSSQELLQAIADGSLAVIYVKDLEGRYILINRRYEELFHVRRDALAGRTDYDLFPRESADAFRAMDQRALATGSAIEAEEVAPQDDGLHTYLSIKYPLRNTAGQVYAVCGISTDITERKQAEEALRQSEARMRAMIDAALDAIIAMDGEGRIREFNPAAETIFGHRRGEVMGRLLAEVIVPPDLREPHRRGLAHYLATGEAPVIGKRIEVSGMRLDGTEVPLEVSISRTPGEGKPIFTGFLRDITEQKRAEQALRASEERFRTMLDSAPVLIWMSGVDKRCTWFNRQWLDFVGRTLEQEIGDGWAESVHPEDLAECRRIYMTAFDDRRPFSMEYRLRRHDGQWRWVFDKALPLANPSGEFAGYIGSCIDVTERKHLEEQLHHSQKMDAMGRLSGGIAHDFNNLLTAINGYADLVLEDASLGPSTRERMEQVLKAGNQAAALTRQLLAFGRRQAVETKRLDINSIVESNAKILRRVIGEDVELVTSLEPGLKSIKADAGQIEQILMNLAVNARDAMPQGGRLTIETHTTHLDESYAVQHLSAATGASVMIAVSDTGCGMDAATQSRIFEPFFTTKEAGKGTGLGLSIVYAIVKQNGGAVWVYSEPGQGTTFKIYFPQVQEELNVISEIRTILKAAAGSETILVVEDDDMVRQLVAAVLQKAGYQTLSARHGQEALQICEQQERPIGLVLTDMIMPEMSGPTLVTRLMERHPGTRFLHMSGYADDAAVRHGYLSSGIPFIQKPFSAGDLLNKVREILDRPDEGTTSIQPKAISEA